MKFIHVAFNPASVVVKAAATAARGSNAASLCYDGWLAGGAAAGCLSNCRKWKATYSCCAKLY